MRIPLKQGLKLCDPFGGLTGCNGKDAIAVLRSILLTTKSYPDNLDSSIREKTSY